MDEQKNIYRAFSTETLESMLRDMTLSEQDLDMDMLDAVMAELDRRQGAPETMDPEAALEVFRTEYAGEDSAYLDCAYVERETGKTKPRKKIGKRVFWLVAAVAVLLAGTLAVVQASKDSAFVAKWTDEHFGFGTTIAIEKASRHQQDDAWPPEMPEELGPPEDFDYVTDASVLGTYDSLQELLDAYHVIPELNAPTYIPEGFDLVKLDRSPSYSGPDFFATYENKSGQSFYVSYVSYSEEPTIEYEKTDAPIELMEIDNVSMYAFSNEASEQIVWITPHYQGAVAGTISREELKKIAQSIYMR